MFLGTLKNYQHRAVDNIADRRKMLLAYPMGSGKTVIALSAAEKMMDEESITAPGIILAGASLKYQWEAEIRRFTNSSVLVVHGTPAQRAKQYAAFQTWAYDYMIITYDTASNDHVQLYKLPRGFVIADECVALKNPRAQRSKRLKRLFKKTPVKVGLSGTPIENGKPEELYSILEFIDPTVLGSYVSFDSAYIVRNHQGWPVGYRNLDRFHEVIAPVTEYRTVDDPDIALELPEEIIKDPVMVTWDTATRRLYRRIIDDLLLDLTALAMSVDSETSLFNLSAHYGADDDIAEDFSLRGAVMQKITAARMLCCHPQLLRLSAQRHDEGTGGSAYAAQLMSEDLLPVPKKVPKIEALKDIVTTALDTDPQAKAVVFCTWVDMLPLIAEALPYESVQFHGALSAKARHDLMQQFRTDPNTRVFVSSDAGGVGVDLPEANLLINVDLPWQAGALDQRNARPRRVSSTWSHLVIEQLQVRDTIEQWQHQMLTHKSAVSAAILQGVGIDASTGDVEAELSGLTKFLSEHS